MSLMNTFKEKLSSTKCIVDMLLENLYPYVQVDDVDMHNKRVLITGANVGIGRALATWMAAHGADVYLLCRNQTKADKTKEEIKQQTGNHKVFVEIVDLSSLKSARDFLDRWAVRPAHERQVDILFNNAGLSLSTKLTTSEGFEGTYVTNMLTSFMITITMLNRGYFNETARIIQTTSAGAYPAGPVDPADPNSDDMLGNVSHGGLLPAGDTFKLYGRSKGMQVAFTQELQARLQASEHYKGIVVQSCHPGTVLSTIWERPEGVAAFHERMRVINAVIRVIGISTEVGASTLLWLATSPDAAQPNCLGGFWYRTTQRWRPAWIEDDSVRRALWKRWESDAAVECSWQ